MTWVVYVPSLLSEAYPDVIVWVSVYETDDRLAAEIVAEWHENVGIRTMTAGTPRGRGR